MANELQPLSLLFQNQLFRIPDYQRGYAWQQPQLADFWDDLINLQTDRYHYTGLLSLKKLKQKDIKSWGSDLWMVDKGFKPCHIVDGQQRLTTFIILLNEIIIFVRNLDENAGKSDEEIVIGYDTLKDVVAKYICQKRPPKNMVTTYLFGYEVDNPSADYLRYKIFNEPCAGTVNETYYTKNLKQAKEFFKDNITVLYKSEGIDGINALYRKLTQQLMFNIHEINDDYDVFVAFETMNNRGKKLTNLELLKNRLIYLTTLYDDEQLDDKDKNELRKQINDAWKEVYFQLGRNKNISLSDDEFLRAHWIIYFTYSRKKGDDYIQFLLRKFSAQNIYKKKTVLLEERSEDVSTDDDVDDDAVYEASEMEMATTSMLEPSEIRDYVNSLKDMAKYWYDTYFPYESTVLSDREKLWIDRLNRIGINYFRPLVAVIVSKYQKLTVDERCVAFEAIERFLFICFRIGGFNTTYCSSDYYRAARSLYFSNMEIADLIKNIKDDVDIYIEYAVSSFATKIAKMFSSGYGYYGWSALKYFMYEYEYSLADKYGINKINWEMFTKTEKDKVSIEHILPQKPSKPYWKKQFRQFNATEITQLSGAIGNLLPLSQSVNSSLQNDSFEDKKNSKTDGRRGYEDGSHSEIAVSKEEDWDADRIFNRSLQLLDFLSKRWNCPLAEEQKQKLIYISFVKDGRPVPQEIDEVEEECENEHSYTSSDLESLQLLFWTDFCDYCKVNGRDGDIATRKPFADNWYDISIGAKDFYLTFTITQGKYISILIYAKNEQVFNRLESKKAMIESSFGDKFDWHSSKQKSVAKRIIHRHEAKIYDKSEQKDIFIWMINAYDRLVKSLGDAGEILKG